MQHETGHQKQTARRIGVQAEAYETRGERAAAEREQHEDEGGGKRHGPQDTRSGGG